MLDKLEQLIAMCPQEQFVGSTTLTSMLMDDASAPGSISEQDIVDFYFMAKRQARPGLKAP